MSFDKILLSLTSELSPEVEAHQLKHSLLPSLREIKDRKVVDEVVRISAPPHELSEEPTRISLEPLEELIKQGTNGLNESQTEAIRNSLSIQGISMIQNPLGTGGLTTMIRLIQILCASNAKIIIYCPNNELCFEVEKGLNNANTENPIGNKSTPLILRFDNLELIEPHLTDPTYDYVILYQVNRCGLIRSLMAATITKNLILIGDPFRKLPRKVSLSGVEMQSPEITLVERMYLAEHLRIKNTDNPTSRIVMLNVNYRTHEAAGRPMWDYYYGGKITATRMIGDFMEILNRRYIIFPKPGVTWIEYSGKNKEEVNLLNVLAKDFRNLDPHEKVTIVVLDENHLSIVRREVAGFSSTAEVVTLENSFFTLSHEGKSTVIVLLGKGDERKLHECLGKTIRRFVVIAHSTTPRTGFFGYLQKAALEFEYFQLNSQNRKLVLVAPFPKGRVYENEMQIYIHGTYVPDVMSGDFKDIELLPRRMLPHDVTVPDKQIPFEIKNCEPIKLGDILPRPEKAKLDNIFEFSDEDDEEDELDSSNEDMIILARRFPLFSVMDRKKLLPYIGFLKLKQGYTAEELLMYNEKIYEMGDLASLLIRYKELDKRNESEEFTALSNMGISSNNMKDYDSRNDYISHTRNAENRDRLDGQHSNLRGRRQGAAFNNHHVPTYVDSYSNHTKKPEENWIDKRFGKYLSKEELSTMKWYENFLVGLEKQPVADWLGIEELYKYDSLFQVIFKLAELENQGNLGTNDDMSHTESLPGVNNNTEDNTNPNFRIRILPAGNTPIPLPPAEQHKPPEVSTGTRGWYDYLTSEQKNTLREHSWLVDMYKDKTLEEFMQSESVYMYNEIVEILFSLQDYISKVQQTEKFENELQLAKQHSLTESVPNEEKPSKLGGDNSMFQEALPERPVEEQNNTQPKDTDQKTTITNELDTLPKTASAVEQTRQVYDEETREVSPVEGAANSVDPNITNTVAQPEQTEDPLSKYRVETPTPSNPLVMEETSRSSFTFSTLSCRTPIASDAVFAPEVEEEVQKRLVELKRILEFRPSK
jgi:hypothetical protein